MCENINKILNKNDEKASYYKEAKLLWDEIDMSDPKIVDKLELIQTKLEIFCKDRNLGQKVMVCYSILHFMETENPDMQSAKKITHILIHSQFNREIQHLAKEINIQYSLEV